MRTGNGGLGEWRKEEELTLRNSSLNNAYRPFLKMVTFYLLEKGTEMTC